LGTAKDHGLPAAQRLRRSREYLRVRRAGRKIQTPNFIIYCLVRDSGPTRLGLTVSRKVGGAVQRNRVKRRLREFFRQHKDLLPKNTDLSVIAKKGSSEAAYREICVELLKAFSANGRARS